MKSENKKSTQLWEKSYTCKNKKDLETLLKKIEHQIKHNKEKNQKQTLQRAKTITTTKLLLKK